MITNMATPMITRIVIATGMIMAPLTPTTITPTDTSMDMVLAEVDGGLPLPLLVWLSPGFPIGAFAYSHGLEWAVEAGDVVDARSLEAWLVDLLEFGAPRSDAILFSAAFGAAAAADWPALMETNVLAVALTASAERRL